MLTIGRTYTLPIVEVRNSGVLLNADNLGDVHLSKKHLKEEPVIGNSIEVFLYKASDDAVIATTEKPLLQLGEYAYLKVVDTSRIGAFVDIGLDKDLLVPFAEQHRPMEVGQSYIVHLYLDKKDRRLTGSSKIDKFLDDERAHEFEDGQSVKLLISNSTDLGYKAIVDNSHWGVLFKNEVFERLSFGQTKQGFIKSVRPDGRLDLSLQGGQQTRDKYSQIILDYLDKNNGYVALHDKSSPADITRVFSMSKGAFKKAIGGLYKQRLIVLEKDGVRLAGES
ncbi:MAG: GntR family transcriptional regulator [Sinobacterium sp.]|nr:GntR family transcriptional regulator [Sinobacterium sp.]